MSAKSADLIVKQYKEYTNPVQAVLKMIFMPQNFFNNSRPPHYPSKRGRMRFIFCPQRRAVERRAECKAVVSGGEIEETTSLCSLEKKGLS